MKREQTKKLCMAGILCAVAVVGSTLSVPVFGSKCAPVQHMVNVLCAVLLGPGYGVGVAFCASLIRNLLALGSILAFPGSMFGALLCGVVYWKSKNLLLTLLGGIWNSDPWRTLCISVSSSCHGCVSRRSSILCICTSVFCIYSRGSNIGGHSDRDAEKSRSAPYGSLKIGRMETC